MAKSSIKSQLGKHIVNLAIDKVNTWAHSELRSLSQDEKFPICIELNDHSYLIGNCIIVRIDAHCWRLIHNDKILHTFYNQQAAMFYAVFRKIHYYKLADQLLVEDQRLSKYAEQYTIYSTRLIKDKKSKKTDAFRSQLYTSKYFDAKIKMESARQDLSKTLEKAKYLKVWDTIL